MNRNQLKAELESGGYTCIAFDDNGQYFASKARGIGPLHMLCQKNTARSPLFVADKVIGKAAALLCAKCNVTTLYAQVVSKDALAVLAAHDIEVSYGTVAEFITNRAGTGKCPMELLAQDTDSPDEVFARVGAFLAQIAKA